MSFRDIWFSKKHKKAWDNFDTYNCPNPCKHYQYTKAIRDYRDGTRIEVEPKEIGHSNFL